MISSLHIYCSCGLDPYVNLAREQILLEQGPEDGLILYLWQNENTVVIGRNQNAYKECRVSLLEEEGGRLARRLSGGGAVFHDRGNLNFTFILPRADFDVARQLSVIAKALRGMGIPAEISGRNDLTAGGQKFSGNAFYKSGARAYHHGTLLVDADMEKLGRYLSPPAAKLKAKGVDSVRSRVVNLKTFKGDLLIEDLKRALILAAEEVYHLKAEEFAFSKEQERAAEALSAHYESRAWRFGAKVPATFSCEKTFPWGTVSLEAVVQAGLIADIAVYTDSMDWELAAEIQSALLGRGFSRSDMIAGLNTLTIDAGVRADLCRMLQEQEI